MQKKDIIKEEIISAVLVLTSTESTILQINALNKLRMLGLSYEQIINLANNIKNKVIKKR